VHYYEDGHYWFESRSVDVSQPIEDSPLGNPTCDRTSLLLILVRILLSINTSVLDPPKSEFGSGSRIFLHAALEPGFVISKN